MNNILKVSKYQIHDFKKSVAIFYAVIVLISFASIVLVSKSPEKVSFGGLESATAIFLFVAGLNCFKSNFKFMLANNVTRKQFYFGNIIALISVAAYMALLDVMLHNVLDSSIPYESVVSQLYKNSSLFAGLIWSFGLNTLFVCLGWFITMLYYRCNKVMKIIVSIAPIPTIALFQYINWISGGLVGRAAADFLNRAMGFTYNNNVYIGALSLLVGAAAIVSICFLPVRNAIAKD